MKSLTDLWQHVARDAGNACCVSTTKDIEYVLRRVENEGVSFLTITLPTFLLGLQKGLAEGCVSPSTFPSFKGSKGSVLPAFLRGYTGLIFDTVTGALLDEPSIEAIFFASQLTGMFKKILFPCSDARIKGAMRTFIETEKEVKAADRLVTYEDLDLLTTVGSLLFREVFRFVGDKAYNLELLPKHGPGKTADGLLGNKKFRQREWPTRMERSFPFGEYCVPGVRYIEEMYQDVNFLDPRDERPVKVVAVPKTLKTPRIIAIEPTCMQYAQQALCRDLVSRIEESFPLNSMVGFSDQTANHRLAQIGSIDGSYATIDLSEASDRVSNQHVLALLKHHPNLSDAVQDCRSRKADVLGFGVIRLSKFASMGSALCFPFEAMVFTTICFIGIAKSLGTTVTRKLIYEYSDKVRIYGDDIIIPREHAAMIVDTLDYYGYRVNRDKSFLTGLFRETCGKEYFSGYDVSHVKVRRLPPVTINDAREVVSLVSLRNQFYKAGCWQTARYLDDLIRRTIKWFPVVKGTSPVLGRHTFLDVFDINRVCHRLHRPLVKGYVVSSKSPQSTTDGLGSLLKYFLTSSDLPTTDREHLVRYGRPKSVHVKLRMAPPF